MKTFVTFLALALLFTSFAVYMSDMNNYMQLQTHLKALAEECAAGAALQLDDSASGGQIQINEAEARSYSENIIHKTVIALPPLNYGSLQVSVEVVSPSAVKADVSWTANDGHDLFRLPFLSVTAVTRSALYAWE